MLDIGALQGNYISVDLAAVLEKQGIKRTKCSQRVSSAMTGLRKETHGQMSFYMSFYNLYTCGYQRIQIIAKVLDIQFDLKIGLPTMKINY